ncbi:hypothetical protein OMK64_13440, partial [Cellulomonas fimi]|nr:hypothetical protein [Cellulomonas fimi]
MPQIQESPAPSTDAPAAAHACGGCLDRRQVLQRAGLVTMGVAAAGVLAACSSSGSGDGRRRAVALGQASLDAGHGPQRQLGQQDGEDHA